MKKFMYFGLFLMSSGSIFAQSPLEKGGLQINAGFGTSSWGTPVYAGLDYGLMENITIGGEVSYRSKTDNGFKYSALGIVANGNYHFNELLQIPSQWDLYGGANLGYYNWTSNITNSNYNSGLELGLQVGGRYFFNDKFGVNLELGGGGVSGGKIGVTYKL
ncbi:hypothetical protein B0A58_03835 [Flavobacterium branchiophilum NBRC 15030 = ATCC 35035]|nr:outer membrane beta-barrel protein [Flavobacterium branchiophilum]OXA79251.1 hypothetical protein B0A58_03835 [Flavobacterium branchiophilum NBRC 15030 = ATCC 35035]